MIDPYTALGVKHGDDLKDIKKAYKKLAQQHHPDRGGDEAKFKEITEAYNQIKTGKVNTQSPFGKQPTSPFSGGFNPFSDDMPNSDTIDEFIRKYKSEQTRSTSFININVEISLKQSVVGGKHIISVQTSRHRDPQMIQIDIPPGTEHGDKVRYPKIYNGNIDLHIVFQVLIDPAWEKDVYDLIHTVEIDFWDAILGKNLEIETMYDSKVKLTIPPKTEQGTKLRLKNLGIKSRKNIMQQGHMFVKVLVKLPKEIPPEIFKLIEQIKR